MLLAWTVGSGEVVLYGLTIFALLTGWPMIRQEEAELEDRFGEEYRAYKRAVPAALVPRVFGFAKTRQH
jgi:protein-S-isoprenylcysteine O-methyltransferase Ste14